MFDLKEHPHRRFNPLKHEWVLVSPHRTKRPWQGQIEETARETNPQYDSECYLCPGNTRAGGYVNPDYENTFVFENDYAALLPETPEGNYNKSNLLIAESEKGLCRVVCFSPRHDLTLSRMETSDIRKVVNIWAKEYIELGEIPFINHVQIFENRGAMMGASNLHPHGQIWASEQIPNETLKEIHAQKEYFKKHQSSLLTDYLLLEIKRNERVICQNDYFAAVVSFLGNLGV